jgi:two-component system, NarL family, sensor histidine kinase DevS
MSALMIDPPRLERLLEVGRSLVSHLDPEVVLREVIEAARDLTGARYAALGVLDVAGVGLDRFLTSGIEAERRRRIGSLPLGHGILGELISDPRPLRLTKINDHPRSYGFPAGHPQMSTFLGVPVTIRGEVFGNLYLTDKDGGGAFNDEDERVVVVLSQWAAIAIDNARSHERSRLRQGELERAVRGLEATVDLSREVGAETDLDRVLELVGHRSRSLLDGCCSVVVLVEGDDLVVAGMAGDIDRSCIGSALPASSPAWDAIRSGHSQRLSAIDVARFRPLGIEAGSALLAPLRSRGRDIGVLGFFHRVDPDKAFSEDDVLAIDSFATAASTAIYAARSIEDEKMRLSIASSDRERRRWARELHDETLQELGALNVMLESALQVDDHVAAREALMRSNEQVERMIAGLQGLITELRPAALDHLGVGPAIEALVDRLGSRSGVGIEVDIDLLDGDRLSPEIESTIYRTVQEALNNVIKHADASRARVLVEERPSEIAIRVEDDGEGFSGAGNGNGFGLVGMRERVALVGGALVINAAEGGGTRVSASLPVARD